MNGVKLLFWAVAGALLIGAGATPCRAEDNAIIKGKIIFAGDMAKCKRSILDTGKDPNCKAAKKKIGSYAVICNKKTDPVTLRNVLVSIKEGLGDRKYPAPSTPVTLTQFGCEYDPHVFGIMEGQTLKVLNGDNTNHNIHFLPKKNQQYNFSQPKKDLKKGRDVTLMAEDVFKVKCDVHPWMGCRIGVFTHPFFSVTGKDGTFELKNVPPGTYVIEAWHEKFGSVTMNVEVASGAVVEKDFTFDPK